MEIERKGRTEGNRKWNGFRCFERKKKEKKKKKKKNRNARANAIHDSVFHTFLLFNKREEMRSGEREFDKFEKEKKNVCFLGSCNSRTTRVGGGGGVCVFSRHMRC